MGWRDQRSNWVLRTTQSILNPSLVGFEVLRCAILPCVRTRVVRVLRPTLPQGWFWVPMPSLLRSVESPMAMRRSPAQLGSLLVILTQISVETSSAVLWEVLLAALVNAQKSPEISMLHCPETLALPCPFIDVLAGVDTFGFFSEVPGRLRCMGRQGVVV